MPTTRRPAASAAPAPPAEPAGILSVGSLPPEPLARPVKRPWRKNVLALLGFAYISMLAVFFGLMWFGATSTEAWEAVEVPLAGLVGASIAMGKDLLSSESPT